MNWLKRILDILANGTDLPVGRIDIDPPRDAMVTIPPYGDEEISNVVRIAANPSGKCPLKVWANDGKGKDRFPYYATGIQFEGSEE